jgi:hypothetical protein
MMKLETAELRERQKQEIAALRSELREQFAEANGVQQRGNEAHAKI